MHIYICTMLVYTLFTRRILFIRVYCNHLGLSDALPITFYVFMQASDTHQQTKFAPESRQQMPCSRNITQLQHSAIAIPKIPHPRCHLLRMDQQMGELATTPFIFLVNTLSSSTDSYRAHIPHPRTPPLSFPTSVCSQCHYPLTIPHFLLECPLTESLRSHLSLSFPLTLRSFFHNSSPLVLLQFLSTHTILLNL